MPAPRGGEVQGVPLICSRNCPAISSSSSMPTGIALFRGRRRHWAEQVDPHHLGDAARIVAIGLVHLRLEESLRVAGLDSHDGQACFSQSAEHPFHARIRTRCHTEAWSAQRGLPGGWAPSFTADRTRFVHDAD